jgi:Zn finger protein HypA/HybF involved in hydrogenase expression
MHEFGLAEGVLETVRRRAAGRPVSRVRVRAGVRHGVDADSMAQAFQFVTMRHLDLVNHRVGHSGPVAALGG